MPHSLCATSPGVPARTCARGFLLCPSQAGIQRTAVGCLHSRTALTSSSPGTSLPWKTATVPSIVYPRPLYWWGSGRIDEKGKPSLTGTYAVSPATKGRRDQSTQSSPLTLPRFSLAISRTLIMVSREDDRCPAIEEDTHSCAGREGAMPGREDLVRGAGLRVQETDHIAVLEDDLQE